MFCEKCGSQRSSTARFCRMCGNPVRRPEASSPHYSVPSQPHMYNAPVTNKSSKASLVVVIIILLTGGIFATLLVIPLIGRPGPLDARTMSVFRIDGDTVSLQNPGGARIDARHGMGLHAGYAVSTGLGSFCYISLDADSIVKMDVSTDISITQLTDRLLRINIDRGQVMVNLQNQSPGHELEAIISNTAISVRGTLFVAGVYAGGEAIITVIEGSVYVNKVLLEAGYAMRVFDGIEMIYEVEPFDFGDAEGFLHIVLQNNQEWMQAEPYQHHPLVGTWAWDFADLWEYHFYADGTGTRGIPGLRDTFTWYAEGNHLLLVSIISVHVPSFEESYTFTITGNALRLDSRDAPGITFNYIRR